MSEWKEVARDGLPPCDDSTVFVGVNSAGFAACFNHVSSNGTCTMGTAESCTAQMSELRWWKVLDRPTGRVHGPSADWNNDYHYPRSDRADKPWPFTGCSGNYAITDEDGED